MATWTRRPGTREWVDEVGRVKTHPAITRDVPAGDRFEDPDDPGRYRLVLERLQPFGAAGPVVVVHVSE